MITWIYEFKPPIYGKSVMGTRFGPSTIEWDLESNPWTITWLCSLSHIGPCKVCLSSWSLRQKGHLFQKRVETGHIKVKIWHIGKTHYKAVTLERNDLTDVLTCVPIALIGHCCYYPNTPSLITFCLNYKVSWFGFLYLI